MKKGNIVFSAILLCALISCATTADHTRGSFAEQHKDDFSFYSLDNGIPVIIKKSESNRLVSLQLIVNGGTACTDIDDNGVEHAVFDMLQYGSASYSYDAINDMCYAKQALLSGSAGPEYSAYALNCIDYYFDDMFAVFADTFLNPSFDSARFSVLTNEYRQALQSVTADPFPLLQRTIKTQLYRNHPYQSDIIANEAAIDNLSVEKLRIHHATLLNAARISIIAVGNFDVTKLIAQLNGAFAALPSMPFTVPPYGQLDFTGAPVVTAAAASDGTAFAARVFSIPQSGTREYAAFALAAQVYDDVLFNIVREKYGSCYSLGNGAGFNGTHVPYGMLYLYRVDNVVDMPSFLAEAAAVMEQGNVLRGKNGTENGYDEIPLRTCLEGYQNSYINSVFSGLRTSAGSASRIMSSYMLHGDPVRYMTMVDTIRSLTAEDVAAAYKKYWCDGSYRWFFVCGENALSSIPVNQYK